jgi:hypothetical protein
VDPVRMSRDAGQVADEVVKHLAGLVDTDVEVRIEITAEAGDGFEDPTTLLKPSCVASLVAVASAARLRVRGGGGMTRQPSWRATALPSFGPVSRGRFARLAGDLIEACVPCPTQPCPGPVDHTDDGEG